jgi:Actinobacteria/chloroflexi VLRF1 release factor
VGETRRTKVPGERLAGWVQRFAAAHGGLVQNPLMTGLSGIAGGRPGLRLQAADGAVAELSAPWPVDGRPGRGSDDVERLASLAAQPRPVGIILLRRGGYAAGVAQAGRLEASRTGTRYVQARTAAGGSSQQRYARRRANQADALIDTAVAHASAVLSAAAVQYLVPGGDRQLIDDLLKRKAMERAAALPRLDFLAVGDPNRKVLEQAARDSCAVSITVTDP